MPLSGLLALRIDVVVAVLDGAARMHRAMQREARCDRGGGEAPRLVRSGRGLDALQPYMIPRGK